MGQPGEGAGATGGVVIRLQESGSAEEVTQVTGC
jgi:hypothetical protein